MPLGHCAIGLEVPLEEQKDDEDAHLREGGRGGSVMIRARKGGPSTAAMMSQMSQKLYWIMYQSSSTMATRNRMAAITLYSCSWEELEFGGRKQLEHPHSPACKGGH